MCKRPLKSVSNVFGAYDVRGIVGREIDETFAGNLGQAYGSYLSANAKGLFLVGHDARPVSKELANAFASGLCQSGHDVVNIELASTPLVNWYGARTEFTGSATVTASHLPGAYTGFKLSGKEAVPLCSEYGLPEIAESMRCGDTPSHNLAPGVVRNLKVLDVYVKHLKQYLRPQRPLKIAVDAGNGAAGPELVALFSGCRLVELVGIAMEATGDYSTRPSNPLEKDALVRLSQAVIANQCDFGVAFDGDADRAIFVDENGQMVPTDAIIALIAPQLLVLAPGATVLYDLRCNRSVPEAICSGGGKPVRTRVGNTFIRSDMQRHQALFAGELSGHYYYADLGGSDNAVRTVIEVINLVSAGHKRVSDMVADCMRYPTSGEINLEVRDVRETLKRLEEAFSKANRDYLDGLSVEYDDWWFNARPSATEKLLRITAGAIRTDILDRQVNQLLALVDKVK